MYTSYTLNTKKILFLFSIISLFFLALYYLSYPFEYRENYLFSDYFSITREKNVPTFFSFTIMILVGLVYYLLYKEQSKIKWLVISLFFFYLGFDDMFKIHEHLGSSVGHAVVEDALEVSFVSYYWQAIFMPMFALFGLYIFYATSKEFIRQHHKSGIYMMFGGFALFAIAIALDFYEGMGSDFFWILEIFESLYFDDVVDLMRATEEGIEMLGGTLILASVLKLKNIKITIQ